MTNLSGRASSTMVAAIAVSAAIAAIQVGAASAAETCLAAPKGGAPAGQHWFYRVESGTKRHCWYLGDQGKTASQPPASTSARRAAPAPSVASNQTLAPSTADAHAEWQRPQAFTEDEKNLNARDLAVPFNGQTPAAPYGSQPDAPGRASAATPDGSSQAAAVFPPPNGVASAAAATSATASMQQADAAGTDTAETSPAETSEGATTETTTPSAAIAAAPSDYSAIGTVPYLIGLTLLIFGALILFVLSGSTIYRRLAERAKRRGPRSFGQGPVQGPVDGAPAPYVTEKPLDADDNLYQLRELLGRLKLDAPPQSEDAVPQLYSGQP
jgi:hypothetical protein